MTREFLLTVLEELSDRGRIPVSVTELSKHAKVSRSTIYKYYPDIVVKINGNKKFLYAEVEGHGLKIMILKKQIKELKYLVEVLTQVCSDQLIEIIEIKAKYSQELESKDIQLAYLESTLTKNKKPVLKTVK